MCVCMCVFPVDLIPGEDLTHQLRHSPGWRGHKAPSGAFPQFTASSGRSLCQSFPGTWGLLASLGSSVTAWEMRGASGAQMPPIPRSLSAVTELGLDGPQQKSRDLHLGFLILQLLFFSNHRVRGSLSLLVPLASLLGKATFVPSSLSQRKSVETPDLHPGTQRIAEFILPLEAERHPDLVFLSTFWLRVG